MSPRRLLLLVVVLAVKPVAGYAADKPQAFTNPDEAGPGYALQGEYVGGFDIGDGVETKFGMQMIDLGGGKFDAVGYFGGLPGEGWDGFTKIQSSGELKDGAVELSANEGSATVKDGVVTVRSADGNELGQLKKVTRKSETEGAEPPAGAVVLFDGKSLDSFNGGKLKDGLLWTQGTQIGAISKAKFNDFTLHLEFRTPFMPTARGQARGNSGLYLQHRYEIQVLDSFGLEGLNNECGGFYQIKEPSANMCYPPLAWQTYDIEFTAPRWENAAKKSSARVTVKHNGVLIHDNLEIPHATPGGIDEGEGPGPIFLQDHGDAVAFRNIWVLEKK